MKSQPSQAKERITSSSSFAGLQAIAVDAPRSPRTFPDSAELSLQERYLNVLRKCLARDFDEKTYEEISPNRRTAFKRARYAAYSTTQSVLKGLQLALVQTNRPKGETMMGQGALGNLHWCMHEVVRAGIPGDFIETGVWRGGGTIYMRAFLEAYCQFDRRVWVADSFRGLPKPDEQYPADKGSRLWESEYLAVSIDQVRSNFRRYELLDDRVCFLEGFFSETMPTAPIDRLAILRLDGDMYESTMVVLHHLYPKLSKGGYVIIDDYGMLPECNRAVEDYREQHHISEKLEIIGYRGHFAIGAYWQKV